MNEKFPINQTKLYGLEKFLIELIKLDKKEILPNKILLSGQKGLGKCTMAYHFINYVLSKNEEFNYDINNTEINPKNHSYKTVLNKSNPNVLLIDIYSDHKFIDISQIRNLISNLNKSSLNNKPRFVLIDNIEFLNKNSINALLKVLEEPSLNVFFILINNNKKILPTLLSRCLNFRISLNNNQNLRIAEKLINNNLDNVINKDLMNYYLTPGNLFNLIKFGINNDYELKNMQLKEFLKIIINNNDYKKDNFLRYLIYDLIEFYFRKIDTNISLDIFNKYNYFLKRISDTKKFNLDEETLFLEFENKVLNG